MCDCDCFPSLFDAFNLMFRFPKRKQLQKIELKFRCWVCAVECRGYFGGPCKHNKDQWRSMCYRMTSETVKSGKISSGTVLIWYQILIQHDDPLLIEKVFDEYRFCDYELEKEVSNAVIKCDSPYSQKLLDIIGCNGAHLINRRFKNQILEYARIRYMSIISGMYLFLVIRLGKDLAKLIMNVCHNYGDLTFYTINNTLRIQPRWTNDWQQLLF